MAETTAGTRFAEVSVMLGNFPFKTARQNMELLLPIAIVVLWIVLQAWVLPRFGVKT
ncbi:MAG TPA: hypothetical protein VNH11_27430 [Pirellulales bacterium]|nr:hypothetical protein [Pirellulales bacterium]